MKFQLSSIKRRSGQSLLNLGIVSAVLMSLVACSPNKKNNEINPLIIDAQNLISTRPQDTSHVLTVLKLKNPALLEASTKKDGKVEIDPELAKAIAEEQEKAIAALKAISSDVQVVYRYKMVLNGLTIVTPKALEEQIRKVGQVTFSERTGLFERPMTFTGKGGVLAADETPSDLFKERNSSKFIGAEKLNQLGITGKGISVGVIDTGVDYTHTMMMGDGKGTAYKKLENGGFEAIDADKRSAAFPNAKVVGGVDLVGTEFNAASPDFNLTIPKPDMNPIDEGGHGTHVAGTVAGIGDGVNSYNGMAPDALIHAIKVFGASGSTSDYVVIAALEYAADPNGDGDISDHLDVVNLSLGGGYGNPHILYSEAIKNLTRGGTFVVASAGNSGHKDYIVGAPGTSDDALSVAASIDDGDQNWKFKASKIQLNKDESILVEAIEAATSKKISEAGNVTGKLVYLGLADQELTEEQVAQLKGHVALIDRGAITFNDKIKRAEQAGAIGVVIANNKPNESPFGMGTTDKFEIPAIAITYENGMRIRENMHDNDVVIEFQSKEKVVKKELIDTLTDFSSKGPRSIDGHIKPEISAPGHNVISADMGAGDKTVQMSGTSMSAPHMAGVMALVKQSTHQSKLDLSNEEYKSLVMGTSVSIGEGNKRYPVSQQGAGRVRADKAVESKIVALQSSLSLGTVSIETQKLVRKTLNIRNLSKEELTYKIKFVGSEYVTLSAPAEVKLAPEATVEVPVKFTLDVGLMKNEVYREMDGWVTLTTAQEEVFRIPVLAVAQKMSGIVAKELIVQSNSERDSDGALAQLYLEAKGANGGSAMLFNYLASDERKPVPDAYMNADCDLQSVGYRILNSKDAAGNTEQVIQFAIKLYKPMTTWDICDVSILVDTNNDGIAEQEIVGANLNNIPGVKADKFGTALLDAAKARELRRQFEKKIKEAAGDSAKLNKLRAEEDYLESLLDLGPMHASNNSSIAILEIATSKLAKDKKGNLSFKVVTSQNEDNTVQMDDYLKGSSNRTISLKPTEQAYMDLSDVELIAGESKVVNMTKGYGQGSLMVLYPENKFSVSDMVNDLQLQLVRPKYRFP